MSAKVDAERAEDRRAQALQRANGLLLKLTRLAKLWAEGKSDLEIGQQLGWSEKTVWSHRQYLTLWARQGAEVAGRWRERLG